MYALRIFSRSQLGILEVSPPGDEGWTLPDALGDHLADSISDPASGPVSAWLSMQPSVPYPLFAGLFLSPSVPLGLFLSWDIPLVFSTICLTQSSWSLFFPVKSTKTSTYLYTIDRHKKKQSICILTTLPSLLKSI